MQLELMWGRMRRSLLRRLWPGYVRRMQQARHGVPGGCPIDPIDSRDVKYWKNQSTYYWDAADDPFRWRDSLPFVRVGLAELILIGGLFATLTAVLVWLWWPAAVVTGICTALIVWFFRDPRREVPTEPGAVVAPADGLVVSIREVDEPDIGPAIEIGIFLSIFDVHINRSSIAGRVLEVTYRPGRMLNALRPESARENERTEILIEQNCAPYRLIRIRQITGAIARRIVCWVAPGDELRRGERFGMIKLGSRTEVVIPKSDDLEIVVEKGQRAKAGETLFARYRGCIDPEAVADG